MLIKDTVFAEDKGVMISQIHGSVQTLMLELLFVPFLGRGVYKVKQDNFLGFINHQQFPAGLLSISS